MHIDPHSGSVDLPELSLSLSSDTRLPDFLATAAGTLAQISVSNPPHISYDLPRFPYADTVIGIRAFFEDDRLIAIEIQDQHERFGASWDEWSEENEQARLQSHNALLDSTLQLGADGASWGTVTSMFDEHGGYSVIVIRYQTA